MLKVERLKRFGVAWPQETQQDIRENGNEHSPTMNLLKNNLNTEVYIVNRQFSYCRRPVAEMLV